MVGSTFIQVPHDVVDAISLKRFLVKLVEQLDIAFGNRGTTSFLTQAEGNQTTLRVQQVENSIQFLNGLQSSYSTLDGTRNYTDIISYDTNKVFTTDTDIISKKYVDDLINILSGLQNSYSTLDGARDYTGIISYDLDKVFTTSTDIISKKYADDLVIGLTANPVQAAITSLAQTISATYVQTEVQAISSKVDTILSALRSANIISN